MKTARGNTRRAAAGPIAALVVALLVAAGAGAAHTRFNVRLSQVTLGDKKLTDAEAAYWFNGNAPNPPITKGNEVLELVDGPETYRQMAAAIRSAYASADPAKPPRLAFRHLRDMGPGAEDPVWCSNPGSLAEDDEGNILTTSTSINSVINLGRVFKLSSDGYTQEILKKFVPIDGSGPTSGLMRAKDGGFYGSTYGGGKFGVGTIFRVGPGTDFMQVFYFRNGVIDPPPMPPRPPTEQEKLDAAGSYPTTAPVQAANGNIYGVTSYANNQQYGVFYTISPTYKGLYFFKGDQGRLPSSLAAGIDGHLYGTTLKGDATCPYGTIFRATTSGSVTALHKFAYATGHTALNLSVGRDGNLYGTASTGGTGTAGVLYRYTLPNGPYTVLHHFRGREDGGGPIAGVVHAKDGYLYGSTTGYGGGSRGTIYRVRPDGSGFEVLFDFPWNWTIGGRHSRITPMEARKATPLGEPILYGITYQGGKNDRGAFHRLEVPRFVYLAGWWLSDNFPLVADDQSSTIQSLFKEASDKGAQVRALLWNSNESGDQKFFSDFKRNTAEVERINGLQNGAAILDNRTLNIGSHHQKLLITGGADGLTAFVGGIDINPDRVYPKGLGPNANGNTEGASLHDVHCRIKGPAVGELLKVFSDRWNDHPDHTAGDDKLRSKVWGTLPLIPPATSGKCWVQVGRTFGNGTARAGIPGPASKGGYSFAPNGTRTAAAMIAFGIRKAQKFIYLEDQYFVDTCAQTSSNLWNVRLELINAINRPTFQHLTVVLPHGDITMMGNPAALVPNQVSYRRKLLIDALTAGPNGHKVHIFYRSPLGPSDARVPHTYVHAKTWIFDDKYAIIGSANTNRRSWTHDSEVVVGICDQGTDDPNQVLLPHRLRMKLWAEHLNMRSSDYQRILWNGADSALWKHLPPGANIAPYTEITPETFLGPAAERDFQWNTLIDPDGS